MTKTINIIFEHLTKRIENHIQFCLSTWVKFEIFLGQNSD